MEMETGKGVVDRKMGEKILLVALIIFFGIIFFDGLP